ncbi:helix-turn-helix transcriptional regulator [Weissella cibaria]|uniref:helix-turn-helix transcriptional regulator n=1 Tax=Weissella cibaria TaxID=137591 RepID=UPI000BFF93B6|nr:helix-turn-helix transcriptional regulator [Weissella cibaria]MCT0954670.1 XRE family transcriptional regulator [Weissella cibaria]TVV19045.1 helix-turn-helix transcriptional regulator [Weissella cibaria]TVV24927.1 helix-turn-helix transcriptional regulator [Weissella cibaria]TVV31623.1 helix-turn-helix transcriptional regulator [Weissella cibaria]
MMENNKQFDFEIFEKLDKDQLCSILGGQSVDIASNLKTLRVTAGMTRDSLAELLMVNPTAVTHWEHGRRIPDVDTLIEIAGVFGTTVDDIIN